MTPTSATATGTGSSATIGINGSVTFSSCETLSLNGVFNTDYDNYMVSLRVNTDSVNNWVYMKVRASGTDASTNYTYQRLVATSTTIVGERVSSATTGWRVGYFVTSPKSGYLSHLYGPFLAQPTAFRVVSASAEDNARVEEYAGTHSTSTSYDGLSLIHATPSGFSGLVSVYGLVGT
jgi:urate oxidase